MRKAAEAKKEADAQLVAETSNEAKRLRAEWFPPQKKSNKSSCSPLCREVLIKLHKNRHKKVLAKVSFIPQRINKYASLAILYSYV